MEGLALEGLALEGDDVLGGGVVGWSGMVVSSWREPESSWMSKKVSSSNTTSSSILGPGMMSSWTSIARMSMGPDWTPGSGLDGLGRAAAEDGPASSSSSSPPVDDTKTKYFAGATHFSHVHLYPLP